MLNLQINVKPETEMKLKRIMEQVPDQEVFFQELIEYRANELKRAIINIEIDLKKYEEKYRLTTEEFYKKYEQGEMEDSEDFMLWAGIYEMQVMDRQKLSELET